MRCADCPEPCPAGRAQRFPAPEGQMGGMVPAQQDMSTAEPQLRKPGQGYAKHPKLHPKGSAKAKITEGRRQELSIALQVLHTFVCWRCPQPWASSPRARGADCPGGCPRSPSSGAPPESQEQSLPCASPCRTQNNLRVSAGQEQLKKQRITAIPEAM